MSLYYFKDLSSLIASIHTQSARVETTAQAYLFQEEACVQQSDVYRLG